MCIRRTTSLMFRISKWRRCWKIVVCFLEQRLVHLFLIGRVCCGNYFWAVLLLSQYAWVPVCCFCFARRKGGRLAAIPAGSSAEGGACGTAPRSLWPEEKWDVLALFFCSFFLLLNFFFPPSCDIELILSCSLWEVTEISLWCGVSWMKSVCCLWSALHSCWVFRREGCGSSSEWFNVLSSLGLKFWEVEREFVWGLDFFVVCFSFEIAPFFSAVGGF